MDADLSRMGAYAALLRAINVGGANKLPMKDLRAMFTDAGCVEVRTYIQSGNVVYSAPSEVARRVPALISTAIAENFGYEVPLIIRTETELRRASRSNPFLKEDVDIRALHVVLLAELPSAARVASLDPDRSPPDEFLVDGREIFLRLPNGVGRSKLTVRYFDSALATTSTMRSWRTLLKLLEMCAGG